MEMLNYALGVVSITCAALMMGLVFRRPSLVFWQGTFVGYSIFLAAPVAILLIFRSLPEADAYAALTIKDNSEVLFHVAAAGVLLYIFGRGEVTLSPRQIRRETHPAPGFLWKLYIAYIAAAIFIFFKSGKLDGGHWYENGATMYQQSVSAVLVGNIGNVLRVVMPAIAIMLRRRGAISSRVLVIMALLTMLFELVVSSNRILVLFWLLALILEYRHRLKKNFVVFAVISPFILQANQYFPIVRGLLWTNGASVNQLYASVEAAKDAHNRDAAGLDRVLGSAVEADNLNVIKYVVNYFPQRHDYFYGSTFFLKGLSFAIPRMLWPEKPPTFGTFIGERATGVTGLALNSAFIGEAYGNFGVLAVPILCLSLFVAGRISRLLRADYARAATFFIALAAWRFDFSFVVIGLSMLLAIEYFRRVMRGLVRGTVAGNYMNKF
ncbi:O-antigen polysaccharide polymerase Wzy [Burkholderia vietnamiensis]|uniref:O-antigen polysaccharide polymerase Wzy n=1 Tax=Burkholderia vietnamiensis TaxID=60552 RepID=UPI000AB0E785|nr:O-antigen polysaccharide polymerase Wzy [Burkholderia vietnamiensis]MDN8044766.1 O-antigen polysaccharide polymerase Wzy [Burkholderia vietnamiensis]HDR9030067.1 O-antigen polysaccharide polymerase Wzy [Burkholderia vietnamiensis]HDR9131587.1 O-antigen polysaccharide polymerase Wzy [Burkholderia vietnamiensis]